MWGLFQGSEASWSEVVPSLTGKEDSGGQQCLSVPVIAGGFYEPVTGLSPAASRPFCPSLGTYSWGRAVLGVVWARGSGGCSSGQAQLQQELARVACLLAGEGGSSGLKGLELWPSEAGAVWLLEYFSSLLSLCQGLKMLHGALGLV